MFDISRRDLTLGAAGACAAFGLDKPITFIDAAHAQQSVTQPFRKYKVGDIEVFSLIDGMRDAPLRDDMVRNVSAEQVKTVLRGAGFPENQAPVRFIVMALKLRDQVVLIDSGTGGHPIYGEGNGRLFESMVAAGLDPKTVKTILISHLHGDHIYGLMNNESDAQVFLGCRHRGARRGIEMVDAPGGRVARSWTDAQGPRAAHSGYCGDLEKRQDL
jgi:glyoxylase-like metal-dependent hydrolase (beta-lactamase superfamily II)